jgi:hypothetical protein
MTVPGADGIAMMISATPKALDDLRDVRQGTEDRKSREHVAVLGGVAVDEPDGLESQLRSREQLLDDELSSIAGSGDEDALSALVPAAVGATPGAVTRTMRRGQGDQRARSGECR